MTFLQDNLVAYTGPKKMEVVYFLLIKHPMRIRNEMVRSSGTMIMTYFLKVIYIYFIIIPIALPRPYQTTPT